MSSTLLMVDNRKMRICVVTTSFPRWPDDIRGTFVFEAARFLTEQGFSVRVIAMHNPGAKTREMMGPIEVIRPRYLWPERLEILQKEGGGLPIMWRKSLLAKLAVIPFFVVYSAAIGRYARGYDIIHANWTLSAAAAFASQWYHRCPIVVTVQGSDIVRATRLPFVSPITRQVLLRCTQVIALSRSLAEATHSLGLPLDKIEVIPNGVDIDRFRPSSRNRDPLILFAGALTEIKGVKYLIQSMPQVLQRFPNYQLILIGEGPQRTELVNLAEALGVVNRVRFVGPQTPAQVSDWMQRARLFVLPSLEEGLGVVLLEALACGTPCVGTHVGGIPDVITPEVGQLVPPANSIALADAIIALMETSNGWNEMSRNARYRAEETFSWNIIVGRLIKIYQHVLSRTS